MTLKGMNFLMASECHQEELYETARNTTQQEPQTSIVSNYWVYLRPFVYKSPDA